MGHDTNVHGSGHGHHHHDGKCGSLVGELIVHFPYAVFSVAASLMGVALLGFFSSTMNPSVARHGTDVLFHTFHFMHIVFASTGVLLTYFRFSRRIFRGIIIGACSSMFFCFLSDVFFPYIAGSLLGVNMHLHICFYSELHNIVPFLGIGLLNGLILSWHGKEMQSYYSVWSHFAHILVSSIAALLYMISHGLSDWTHSMGIVFLLLITAVVIPCTLSDVVVPLYFAKKGKDR